MDSEALQTPTALAGAHFVGVLYCATGICHAGMETRTQWSFRYAWQFSSTRGYTAHVIQWTIDRCLSSYDEV